MAQRSMPAAFAFVMKSPMVRAMQRANTWLYRRSNGRLGGSMRGAPICLLTTRGAKSGQLRTVPLLYLADAERVILVASKGGVAEHPLWYRNLTADPAVQVQIGGQVRELRARTASEEERAAYWPRLVAMYADYANYQSWTDRTIPVVILEPAPG
jgi:deazaflavin-dependent oxidoreductase (nitroreductase family)